MNFIKIDNNIAISVSSIKYIRRYSVDNDFYHEWYNAYNTLMNDVTEQYLKTSNTEQEIDDELIDNIHKKFNNIVKNSIENELGPKPEPFVFEYEICIDNNTKFQIDEQYFNLICNELNIPMNDCHDDMLR